MIPHRKMVLLADDNFHDSCFLNNKYADIILIILIKFYFLTLYRYFTKIAAISFSIPTEAQRSGGISLPHLMHIVL